MYDFNSWSILYAVVYFDIVFVVKHFLFTFEACDSSQTKILFSWIVNIKFRQNISHLNKILELRIVSICVVAELKILTF